MPGAISRRFCWANRGTATASLSSWRSQSPSRRQRELPVAWVLALLCRRKGIAPDSAALIPMEQYRQQQFDLLADGVRGALDLDAVYAAMGLENPRRNAQ